MTEQADDGRVRLTSLETDLAGCVEDGESLTKNLAVTRAEIENSPYEESIQETVTELAACVEDIKVRVEMSNKMRQHLADRIRFITAGAVRSSTRSGGTICEGAAVRLTDTILRIMTGEDLSRQVIDEDAYRAVEPNTVGTLVNEVRPNPAFQMTYAQSDGLLSVFGNVGENEINLNRVSVIGLMPTFAVRIRLW